MRQARDGTRAKNSFQVGIFSARALGSNGEQVLDQTEPDI